MAEKEGWRDGEEMRGEGEENRKRTEEQWRGEIRGEVIMHIEKKWRGRERVPNRGNGVERRRQWRWKGMSGSCKEKTEGEREDSGVKKGREGKRGGVNVLREKVRANIRHYCGLQMF